MCVARVPCPEHERGGGDLGKLGGITALLIIRKSLLERRSECGVANYGVRGTVPGIEQTYGLVAGLDLDLGHEEREGVFITQRVAICTSNDR